MHTYIMWKLFGILIFCEQKLVKGRTYTIKSFGSPMNDVYIYIYNGDFMYN